MRLITAFFGNQDYARMLDVMCSSVKKNMPGQTVEIITVPDPEKPDDKHKLTYFGFIPAALEALESLEDIAVADLDLMFTGDIRSVFSYDFDVAVTVRNHRMLYNTGLWFARPTFQAKEFIKQWIDNTHRIYNNYTIDVVHRWGGIDQQALAETIEQMPTVNVLQLPCQIWNAEQTCWAKVNSETKVVHIKSGLRPLCLNDVQIPIKFKYLRKIVEEWKAYENTRI